jgi:hypothetical protein
MFTPGAPGLCPDPAWTGFHLVQIAALSEAMIANPLPHVPYSTDDLTYLRLMIVPARITMKSTAPIAEAAPKLLNLTAW